MTPKRNPFGIGPQVSLFTLGTMRSIESVEQMHEVIKKACHVGINHIETAPAYGPAEIFVGESLKKLASAGIEPEGGWVITSKILPGTTVKEGKDQIKAILARLGIEKIDNLAIHGINLDEHLDWVINGEGSELLNWVEGCGLVRQIGFSSHGSFPLIQETIESHRFQFCSLHLHLLDQTRMPLALSALNKGMGVMAISPADKGGHLHSPSQVLIDNCKPFSPLEIAYRFLLSNGISTLTLGASKTQDLLCASNLINSNTPLDESEQKAIARIAQNTKHRLGSNYCGQCRKCLPCPKEVPIPEILRLRNLGMGLDLRTFAEERYNLIGKAGHWWEQNNASACEKCGDCLPRCPNNLNIPELLQETHHQLASSPQRRLWG